jgi:hypothetical protein
VLGRYDGVLTNCNTIIGTVRGATTSFPLLSGRVRGCRYTNGNACTTATFETLDDQATQSAQRIVNTRFSAIKLANANFTCAQVRAMTFP